MTTIHTGCGIAIGDCEESGLEEERSEEEQAEHTDYSAVGAGRADEVELPSYRYH